jgi:hypothetical protein
MPYIPADRRHEIFVEGEAPRNAGELNFVITMICFDYLNNQGLSYDTLNAIAGVLSNLDKEWYRRLTAPYEDKKIRENGDLFIGC